MYLNVFLNYLSNIKYNFVMSLDYYNISFKKCEIISIKHNKYQNDMYKYIYIYRWIVEK